MARIYISTLDNEFGIHNVSHDIRYLDGLTRCTDFFSSLF